MHKKLILPESLHQSANTGVLDTPQKVREASEELRTATETAFEEFRVSRQKSLEEATRRFLD